MKLAQALSLSSTSAFQEAIAQNIEPWFQKFLSQLPRKEYLHTRGLPFGRFSHVLRKAMAGRRKNGDHGVATGQWCMPSGLTASQAWHIIQAEIGKLSIPLLLQSVMASGGAAPAPMPQRMVFHTPKHGQLKMQVQAELPVHDPLQGLNRPRLMVRLRKAWKKGTAQVHFLTTDLTRMLQKLPEYTDVDPARRSQAIGDILHVLAVSSRAMAWRCKPTAEELQAQAFATERHEAKLAKQVERRQRRRQNRLVIQEASRPESNVIILFSLHEEAAPVTPTVAEPTAQQQWEGMVCNFNKAQAKSWFKLARRKGTNRSGAVCKANRRRKTAWYAKRVAEGVETRLAA